MYQLPQAFSGLANNKKFVVAEITPKLGKNGIQELKPNGFPRWDKKPKDDNGWNLEWREPNNLITLAEAQDRLIRLQSLNTASRWGLGYIFTPDDGYVFIDLDNCITPDGSGWNDIATAVLSMFPGAAVEVSSSSTGLHIVCRGSSVVKHKCKNPGATIELYTGNKFMMFGQPNAIGDCEIDHSLSLTNLIQTYMLEGVNREEWGKLVPSWELAILQPPHESHTAIPDNNELIAKIMDAESKNPEVVFGGKQAKFKNLWEGDWSGFESQSEADASLISILCFWTGNHASRIEELMHLSGLYREKFDRADYLPHTILKMRGRTSSFYHSEHYRKSPQVQDSAGVGTCQEIRIGVPLTATQQQELFKGLVHIAEENRVLLPNGEAYKEDAFNALSPYSNHSFIFNQYEKEESKAFRAFTQSKLFTKTQVDRRCFRPDLPDQLFISEKGKTFYNEYRAIHGARLAGDASPFTNHLRKMIPNDRDREIFTCYIAALIQYLGRKFRWCTLLQGVEGNGKSFIAKCLRFCVGDEYYSTISARALNDSFNDWQYKKILIVMEEVYSLEGRFETGENVKDKITNDYPQINKKNVTPMSMRVCCNYLLNTNHKNSLKVTSDARRFAVFFTAQQSIADKVRDGMTKSYWDELHLWLEKQGGFEIVHDYLATYSINPDFNPALGGDAPRTSSHQEAIEQSMGGVEQEILEAIDTGLIGFRGGWVSSAHVCLLLERMKLDGKINLNHRSRILEGMGYIKHPNLFKGRASNLIPIDNKQSYLYIKADSSLKEISKPSEIVNAYVLAQS